MPRIPRRSDASEEEGTTPQEQRTVGAAPSTDPSPPAATSGDPLASAPLVPPAPEAATATPGDALAGSVPPTESSAPTGVTPPAADPARVDPAAAEPVTEVTPPDRGEQPTQTAEPVEQPTVAAPAVPADAAATAIAGTPAPVAAPPAGAIAAPEPETEAAPEDARPRFRERTRMRRRLRYLRRLRELAFRDLGGLVFDLHRFGRDRNDLVAAKLEALGTIDRELRLLEDALADRREFTDLREAGIAACPRCGTLHDTDANFCPGCGAALRSALVRDAAPVTVTPADEATPPAPS